MDKSIYVGTATCIISIAIGAWIQISVSIGMITQSNAIYFFIGAGVLFLVGAGFLIYGVRLKPNDASPGSIINRQSSSNVKTVNQPTHKLFHAIICEITGAGLIVWGASTATQDPSVSTSGFIGVLMILFGLGIFIMGVTIGTSK